MNQAAAALPGAVTDSTTTPGASDEKLPFRVSGHLGALARHAIRLQTLDERAPLAGSRDPQGQVIDARCDEGRRGGGYRRVDERDHRAAARVEPAPRDTKRRPGTFFEAGNVAKKRRVASRSGVTGVTWSSGMAATFSAVRSAPGRRSGTQNEFQTAEFSTRGVDLIISVAFESFSNAV
ncbi:hypothetical protein [Paraburkholderia ferrariae]|uniref:hypothetical protein n=1 Tax=Paraburkholderia ferrariae TaxID=386056 RepID=UPI000483C577